MPVHLLFLFLFQSALAFAFSYFIARVIISGSEDDSRDTLIRGISKVRNIALVGAFVLPAAMFVAYYNSLPEGKPATIALWPAGWIFMIMLAVVLALSLAGRGKAGAQP